MGILDNLNPVIGFSLAVLIMFGGALIGAGITTFLIMSNHIIEGLIVLISSIIILSYTYIKIML